MHIFQLMLTTYLYVAHSTILSEPSEIILSLPLKNLKRKTKILKYLDIWILQTSKHSQALAQECSGAFPL